MKYYQMAWRVPGDASIVYQQNLIDVPFWSGHSISSEMMEPLDLLLDEDFADGQLPTFYDTPALVARKTFHAALVAAGVSNLEVFPAQIRDETRKKVINDYVLLNVIGLVSCADLDQSEYGNLGDEEEPLLVIDKLVIKADRVKGLDMFLVMEDPQFMVISERVCKHLERLNLDDLFLEELESV
jgi:hypothetical protein